MVLMLFAVPFIQRLMPLQLLRECPLVFTGYLYHLRRLCLIRVQLESLFLVRWEMTHHNIFGYSTRDSIYRITEAKFATAHRSRPFQHHRWLLHLPQILL